MIFALGRFGWKKRTRLLITRLGGLLEGRIGLGAGNWKGGDTVVVVTGVK